MGLNNLKPTKGSIHNSVQRGRGYGCGLGKTSGRGQKGQGARAGGGPRLGFAGGQTPLYRRLPKFGFTNGSRKEFAIVNVGSLNKFAEGTEVTPTLLVEAGLVKAEKDGVKILGNGELNVKLVVKAHKFSASAKAAIEKVGGTVEVL